MNKNYFKLILVIMVAAFCFAALPVSAAEEEQTSNQKTSGTQVIKYPPYPDVWDWQDTTIPKASIFVVPDRVYEVPGGDVLIYYYRTYAKREKLEAHAVTFFERKKFVGVVAEQLIDEADKYLKSIGKKRSLEEKLSYEAVSKDGIWQIKSMYSYDLQCYAGANRYPYKLINAKTGDGKIFTVFRLLDEAMTFYIPESCGRSEKEKVIKYKVESVSGDFFILEDNSFLFQVEKTGDVIRFDFKLKSKSNLVGDRYFLIENNGEHDAGIEELEQFKGRKYEDTVSQQVITNDLYDYLNSKRKWRK